MCLFYIFLRIFYVFQRTFHIFLKNVLEYISIYFRLFRLTAYVIHVSKKKVTQKATQS